MQIADSKRDGSTEMGGGGQEEGGRAAMALDAGHFCRFSSIHFGGGPTFGVSLFENENRCGEYLKSGVKSLFKASFVVK